MAAEKLTTLPVFGFETNQVRHQSKGLVMRNGVKIAGYIPLIGIITGSFRIYQAVIGYKNETNHDTADKKRLARHITRGAVEALGCGILLAVVDASITVKRHAKEEPSSPTRSSTSIPDEDLTDF